MDGAVTASRFSRTPRFASGKKVAVKAERDPHRRLAHLRLQLLRMCASDDDQRGVGVVEVIEADAAETAAPS